MQRILFIFTALLVVTALRAQSPVPAQPQTRPVAITGATAHLGNGQVIENALITFADGKITQVAPYQAGAALSGYEVIDARGKHVYPSFIAANSQLGLVEIGAVRATNDNSETGEYNPNVRAIIAYNTDSQVSPTVRSRGTLLAQIVPDGGLVAGHSSVVQLDAWNWEDAALRADDGLHLNWPRRSSFSWQTGEVRQNENYQQQIDELEQFLRESKAYCEEKPANNSSLRLGAMCPVFSGERNVYIRVNAAKDIKQAVLLAEANGMKPVVVGGEESFLITDFLKEHNVPVILQQMHSLPGRVDDDVDQPYKTPAMLQEAGVLYAISMDGYWQQRNLAFQAGTAVAHGLDYEAAVQALTLSPARILGVENRVGTLEAGKDATLFISTGDALDMRTSHVERAFIEGRAIDLDNKQDGLYRKFQEKYTRLTQANGGMEDVKAGGNK